MQEKITLRAARVNAGLTLEAAAKKIGVNSDTLSRWEKGKTHPDVLQFKTIERTYKIKYANIAFEQ